MNMYKLIEHQPSRQQGAALIVGLMLLVVLSVLAIAGINSASLEFIMAGNEQYKQNAFQAAETGIQIAINNASFSTNSPPGATITNELANPLAGTKGDTYDLQIVYIAENDLAAGSSIGAVSDLYYKIQTTGHSARNAITANTQGIAIEVPTNKIYN